MAPDTAADRNVRVTVTRSAGADSAVLVIVDTSFEPDGSDGGPGLRVMVNDGAVFDGVAYVHTDVDRGVVPERALDIDLSEIAYAGDGLEATCRHCGRRIVTEEGRWVDPEATGDDSVWRETCDAHDTFVADHEPVVPDGT